MDFPFPAAIDNTTGFPCGRNSPASSQKLPCAQAPRKQEQVTTSLAACPMRCKDLMKAPRGFAQVPSYQSQVMMEFIVSPPENRWTGSIYRELLITLGLVFYQIPSFLRGTIGDKPTFVGTFTLLSWRFSVPSIHWTSFFNGCSINGLV